MRERFLMAINLIQASEANYETLVVGISFDAPTVILKHENDQINKTGAFSQRIFF